MKFVAKLMVVMGLAFSMSASAGIIVGGGGLGKSRLQFTSLLLQQTELQKFTLLPASEKDLTQETDIPEDLKFVPDDEFTDLLDMTLVQLTDENGKVLKTYTVRRLDETPVALVFVEVAESEEKQ
ncbi:MAG TPA: hypothetical protein VFO10_25450 [Oligoflexus sp.]|uniref:hypothetical protein n=1 Tax=Oligoflexus sp. TaxID=1971216 RepID=UPI002D7F2489|nr:hypothetical protein [Oligoflexus sp.]HET9240634.1 hypothetical protein [Oligoflexus sp.]